MEYEFSTDSVVCDIITSLKGENALADVDPFTLRVIKSRMAYRIEHELNGIDGAYDVGYETGWDEGHAEGKEVGYDDGRRDTLEKIEQLIRDMD